MCLLGSFVCEQNTHVYQHRSLAHNSSFVVLTDKLVLLLWKGSLVICFSLLSLTMVEILPHPGETSGLEPNQTWEISVGLCVFGLCSVCQGLNFIVGRAIESPDT